MIALITCAHVGVCDIIKSKGNAVLWSIFKNRKERVVQYIESINRILSYKHYFNEIYLMECIAEKIPSYLAAIPQCKTVIANNSLHNCSNKGIHEFVNIANFLNASDIRNDELIVKITGRYILRAEDFLKASRKSLANALVKKDSDVWGDKGRGVHTCLFSARKRTIIDFSDWIKHADRYKKHSKEPVEWIFMKYLQSENIETEWYSDKLHLTANYAYPLEPKNL